MSLPNLVQLVCNEGREGCLNIERGEETGEIYFSGGAVVHAAASDLEGEAAFIAITKWTDGDFSLEYDVPVPTATIDKTWSSLLLTALHELDESAEETEYIRREYYNVILGNLVTVDEVNNIVIAGTDGSVYAENSGAQSDVEGLLAAFVYAVAAELGDKFDLGGFVQFVVFSDAKPVVIIGFEKECYEFSLRNGSDPEMVGAVVRDLLKMLV
jgi:predicted regulator of Ras-like GTPase activity (Roadblock/LC7/MglB family)